MQKAAQSHFDINVSLSTLSRFLRNAELSVQLTGKRPLPVGMTEDEYVLGYFEFLAEVRRNGVFRSKRRKIMVDATTNSERNHRVKSVGMKGGKQKKIARRPPQFTNDYTVAVDMETSEGLVTLMFTYDPTFKPGGKRWKEVLQWCRNYGVNPNYIYYCEPPSKGKKYCKESYDHWVQLEHVCHDAMSGAIIFRDNGTSFMKNKVDVFDEVASEVIRMPSAQHGELSVLDNKLFAVAKAWWYAERRGIDPSEDAVKLLQCINWVSASSVQSFWRNNFFLEHKNLSLAIVHDKLKERNDRAFKRKKLYKSYAAAYERHIALKGGEMTEEQRKRLGGSLDGVYWKE